MERIVKKIYLAYYLIYTLTILATIVGYFISQSSDNVVNVKSQLSINLSSFVILYIIVSIPASLSLFHRNTKKWIAIEDLSTKLEKYTSGASLRIFAVGFGLILSVVSFYIIRSQSMIFCAGIAAIALLFCKPTENKIKSDLKLDEPEEEEKE